MYKILSLDFLYYKSSLPLNVFSLPALNRAFDADVFKFVQKCRCFGYESSDLSDLFGILCDHLRRDKYSFYSFNSSLSKFSLLKHFIQIKVSKSLPADLASTICYDLRYKKQFLLHFI